MFLIRPTLHTILRRTWMCNGVLEL